MDTMIRKVAIGTRKAAIAAAVPFRPLMFETTTTIKKAINGWIMSHNRKDLPLFFATTQTNRVKTKKRIKPKIGSITNSFEISGASWLVNFQTTIKSYRKATWSC